VSIGRRRRRSWAVAGRSGLHARLRFSRRSRGWRRARWRWRALAAPVVALALPGVVVALAVALAVGLLGATGCATSSSSTTAPSTDPGSTSQSTSTTLHPGLYQASSTGDKWGFIDKTGTFVIEPRYDYVYPFSEGLSAVCVGDEINGWKWGYIDTAGTLVVPMQLASATPFSGASPRSRTTRRGNGASSTRPARLSSRSSFGFADSSLKASPPRLWNGRAR